MTSKERKRPRTCKTCGLSSPRVKFHAKRTDCTKCRLLAERKTPLPVYHNMCLKNLPDAQRYVVTYAQNATPVHKGFLQALKNYCTHNNAVLVVIPGLYKNPTSIWTKKEENTRWWHADLGPYLFYGRKKLGHLVIYGDISIQPTAVRPLSGMEVFAGADSAIFGHPKIQLMTVATAKRRYPRIFTTTGAVTRHNYTASKAGKKGEAHHVLGATIVERVGDMFHLRQINATEDGAFIDLTTKYSRTGISPAGRPLALVCGDIHDAKRDEHVLQATFTSQDSIVQVLKPRKILFHDVLDFDARNHHTIGDFSNRFERALGGKLDCVETEVNSAIKFLDDSVPPDTTAYVIASNHDEAFDRWLSEANPKIDPINAMFFHEAWYKVLSEYKQTRKIVPAFELFYRQRGAGKVTFIDRDTPLKIGNIYCNFHGDKGVNGSRGTALGYSKLGVKTIIGHVHSPSITDGCYAVGVTGRLDMGYNVMPTSWLNSHVVIYANGKRSLISVVDGSWRATANDATVDQI